MRLSKNIYIFWMKIIVGLKSLWSQFGGVNEILVTGI